MHEGLDELALEEQEGDQQGRNRELLVRADDDDISELLDRALTATLAVWRSGSFVPRLVKHDENAEPTLCRFCEVAEACLRGDSGSRGRLRGWTSSRHPTGEVAPKASELAILANWYLSDREAAFEDPGAGEPEERS